MYDATIKIYLSSNLPFKIFLKIIEIIKILENRYFNISM